VERKMPSPAELLGANKAESTLLVLFIPSVDRFSQSVDQALWVDEALKVLGECFSGATAFPQGRGVWRDNSQGGALIYDQPVVIQCYTSTERIEQKAAELRAFLVRMGTETRQGAVGLVIDREYLEIGFPLPG
jgi:hypothetical protein